MKTTVQDLQYHNELLWEDLLKCYVHLSTKKNVDTRLLINAHKKLLNRLSVFGKNKHTTLKLLIFFINMYENNRSQALQIFMCTLNNRGILGQNEKH